MLQPDDAAVIQHCRHFIKGSMCRQNGLSGSRTQSLETNAGSAVPLAPSNPHGTGHSPERSSGAAYCLLVGYQARYAV